MSHRFNEPAPKKCRLCGSTENLEYCSICHKYFCQDCKDKYPERVEAMMQERVVDPVKNFLDTLFKKN